MGFRERVFLDIVTEAGLCMLFVCVCECDVDKCFWMLMM